MSIPRYRFVILLFLGCCLPAVLEARAARFRCMWRDDPATTMVIGWDQLSGSYPELYYDEADFGRNAAGYRNALRPDQIVYAKGMNNCFARLTGLQPNTTYYFIVKDSEGVSRRLSFKTAPADPDARLSIIAGGDSRNNRDARRSANLLVSKLRPTFIMFDGDMTAGDSDREWQNWFDDWQLTIGSDGRLFPVIVARGNHEMNNETLVKLFDIPVPEVYYGLTFARDLLRVYTLNSLIAPGGDQKGWLERDLQVNSNLVWRFAQYHHSIRPHTARKTEKDELLFHWAQLFYRHRVQLVLESDAHVVKWTWPIRPSLDPGSAEGFVRDDERGTVYIGEGCWGAPLRDANDPKPWTRDLGSFNQFKWIFVDREKMEIRTVRTDDAEQVAEIDHRNLFEPPLGLVVWSPSNGDVVIINNPDYRPPVARIEIEKFTADARGSSVHIEWTVSNDPSNILYELQCSTDGGRTFAAIGTLRGGANPDGVYRYRDDRSLAGSRGRPRLSYRLRCIPPRGETIEFETEVRSSPPAAEPPGVGAPAPSDGGDDWAALPRLTADAANRRVNVRFDLDRPGDVDLILVNRQFQEQLRGRLRGQPAGAHIEPFDLSPVPSGDYLLVIKANGRVIKKYRIIKKT